MILAFDRNHGFLNNPWSEIKATFSENGFKLVEKYTKKIEDEHNFRFITDKKFEKIIIGVFVVILTFLIVFGRVLAGVLFLSVLVIGLYTLSVIKGRMLVTLQRRFDGFIKDLDEKYFGAKITNVFGSRGALYYILLPVSRLPIQISVMLVPHTVIRFLLA